MQQQMGSPGRVTYSVEYRTCLECPEVPLRSTQDHSDLLRTIQERIHSVTRANFKGQPYIQLEDLRRVLSTKLISDLLGNSKELRECCLTHHEDKHDDLIVEVKNKALLLLGACLLANVPLGTFMAFLSDGISDEDLPLDDRLLPSWVKAPGRGSLLVHQYQFLPFSFDNVDIHGSIPAGIPLPIVFDELDDRVGHGSFSEVYKVKVDSEAKPFREVYFGNPLALSVTLTTSVSSTIHLPSSVSNVRLMRKPSSLTNVQCSKNCASDHTITS